MECAYKTMQLVDFSDLNRIENTLLERKNQIVQATSTMFNVVLLALVLSGFAFFLYTQYKSTAEKVPEQNIPFKPVVWYSATRNVREEDYSKPFEVSSQFESISG
jgi:hypothetical protein